MRPRPPRVFLTGWGSSPDFVLFSVGHPDGGGRFVLMCFVLGAVLDSVWKRPDSKEGALREDGGPADHPVCVCCQRRADVLWCSERRCLRVERNHFDQDRPGCTRGTCSPFTRPGTLANEQEHAERSARTQISDLSGQFIASNGPTSNRPTNSFFYPNSEAPDADTSCPDYQGSERVSQVYLV